MLPWSRENGTERRTDTLTLWRWLHSEKQEEKSPSQHFFHHNTSFRERCTGPVKLHINQERECLESRWTCSKTCHSRSARYPHKHQRTDTSTPPAAYLLRLDLVFQHRITRTQEQKKVAAITQLGLDFFFQWHHYKWNGYQCNKCGIRILINILQFTITKILGNSGACVNSVYQAAFLSGLESRLKWL